MNSKTSAPTSCSLHITPSPLGSYLGRLLDFAVRSHWGKRPIARAEAFAI